jgi:hypothetical protein
MTMSLRPALAIILTFLFFTNISSAVTPVADKITPEEIVAKHIEAIGKAEARKSSRSRIVAGTSVMNLTTGGRGTSNGAALLASHNEKVLLKAEFNSPSYPFEKLGFDGRKLHAKQYSPGVRSPLAEFFMSHDTVFSEGLIGGTLSSAWPLLDLAARAPKLQYAGTEKIDGRQAHKLRYLPHGGGELKITIFIDVENFQHLRTQYERVIAAPMGASPAQSATQREMRYQLVEDFRDFKTEGGLMLPHKYTVQFFLFKLNNPISLDWTFNLTRFTFDYPIEEKQFLADT